MDAANPTCGFGRLLPSLPFVIEKKKERIVCQEYDFFPFPSDRATPPPSPRGAKPLSSFSPPSPFLGIEKNYMPSFCKGGSSEEEEEEGERSMWCLGEVDWTFRPPPQTQARPGKGAWDGRSRRRRRRQKPRFRSGHLRSLSPSLLKLNLRANDNSPLQIHPLQRREEESGSPPPLLRCCCERGRKRRRGRKGMPLCPSVSISSPFSLLGQILKPHCLSHTGKGGMRMGRPFESSSVQP